jgi:integrase
MVLLALRTGLRQGELLGLRWDDIDLVTGRLMVRRSAVRGVVGTKNGKSRGSPFERRCDRDRALAAVALSS